MISDQEHRFLIAEQLRAAGVADARIILEPAGRNTAPAAAMAALKVLEDDPDGLVLLMPSDHVVSDVKAFRAAVAVARQGGARGRAGDFRHQAARAGNRLWLYQGGAALAGVAGRVCQWSALSKSPIAPRRRAISPPANITGTAACSCSSAKAFLAEMERLEPAMLASCRDAIAHAHRDMDFIRLGEAGVPGLPVAIHRLCRDGARRQCRGGAGGDGLERCRLLAIAVGHRAARRGWQCGQGRCGRSQNARNSYIRSEGPLVAAVGVENLVVVATKDAVLVSHRDSAQDVKKIVEQLEAQGRDQHIHHAWCTGPGAPMRASMLASVFRSSASSSSRAPNCRCRCIITAPSIGSWCRARRMVTCDDRQFLLQENKSTFIPLGARHRLENPGKVPLHLIEVQSGAYLGEDDIVRFEDTYGRAPKPQKSRSKGAYSAIFRVLVPRRSAALKA